MHTTALLEERILKAVQRFTDWLDRYGEVSYDFQTFYASRIGQSAKALYYSKPLLGAAAVAPIIFCEAFIPSARNFFFKPQRFPIADAHYAMGFFFLATLSGDNRHYARGVDFLNILKQTRCTGHNDYCWGYPFNWVTINGTIKQGTPLITTVPYVYEAFKQAHELDGEDEWFQIMRSIAQHALLEYEDIETSPAASSCSYTPGRKDSAHVVNSARVVKSAHVVNANAYRAFLLTSAARDFADDRYRRTAQRNLNFVLEAQNPDGSWYYATDGKRDFVDHFHTCFVLKALAKIEMLTGDAMCSSAIEKGIRYYVKNLFDERGIPKPFSRPPRLIVYRRELYDFAECINLGTLLRGRFPELDRVVSVTVDHILTEWQKPEGSFRTRRLLLGWDNVPMHRWAQAQLFRSLCGSLYGATPSGKKAHCGSQTPSDKTWPPGPEDPPNNKV